MAFIDSSELGHCPTAQLLIENEVPSRIAAKDGSVFDFSAEIADYAATRLGWTTLASRPPSDPAAPRRCALCATSAISRPRLQDSIPAGKAQAMQVGLCRLQ